MNIKENQIVNFKKGEISQSTFLKTFKDEIENLVAIKYKPREIEEYFKSTYDVKIDRTKIYIFLRDNKKKYMKKEANLSSQKTSKNLVKSSEINEAVSEKETYNDSSNSVKSGIDILNRDYD